MALDTPEIKAVAADLPRIEADALIVNLFEGVTQPGGATGAVDKALDGAIGQLIGSGEIKGKFGELTMIHTFGRIAAKRVLVAGLGKQQQFTLDRIRRISAEACRFLRGKAARRVATIVHGAGSGGVESSKAAQAIAEGAILGLYTFRRHITREPDNGRIEELLIVERDEARLPDLVEGCHTGCVIADSVVFARDMINEPGNFMTPGDMAETARNMAGELGLECTVLEREQMQEMGMGALLAVSQGSQQPPRFIVLKYSGDSSSQKAMGLAGKGITFDSGGISLKHPEDMGEMKTDMAGGATVMATLRAVARLNALVNVTALVPATENLPGGRALKPGDIVTAMNGKTIEIVSTDAEGRLILADALSYGAKLGLTPLIDVATLTGACRVALGDVATGVFTNSQALIEKIVAAADEAGERVWQMPMFEDYKEQNKSEVADMKNSGGRNAGAITAAQFLGEFVGDAPWVHLDIAGTAYTSKEKGFVVKGATGAMVRTLVGTVLSMARNAE
jgi:leucyl aminopeptidase